jgi:hypothetical protein
MGFGGVYKDYFDNPFISRLKAGLSLRGLQYA